MSIFKPITDFFNRIPEDYLDVFLWMVGLSLIAVALYGERKHKAWACLYVMVP